MEFDKLYRELMLEFSEGAIRNIVKKFQNDATEQEIRREVQDFEKYKNALQKKDPFQYKSWIEFTEAIHAAKGKAEFKRKKAPTQDVVANQDDIIADDENVTIYRGDSQDKCVLYGKGYSFCISRQVGGNMFSNYRLGKESTFYFIYFKKKPKSAVDHIMVLDHTKHGYEWTFADNDTKKVNGGWDEVVGKYPELKKYEKLLVNKKLDDEESEFIKVLKNFSKNPRLENFNKFSYEQKAQALKSVVDLSDQIWNALDSTLRNEFLSIGPNLTKHQAFNLKPNEIERYKKTRNLSRQHLIDDYKYKENIFDFSDDERLALEYMEKVGSSKFFKDDRLSNKKLKFETSNDYERSIYDLVFDENGALVTYQNIVRDVFGGNPDDVLYIKYDTNGNIINIESSYDDIEDTSNYNESIHFDKYYQKIMSSLF